MNLEADSIQNALKVILQLCSPSAEINGTISVDFLENLFLQIAQEQGSRLAAGNPETDEGNLLMLLILQVLSKSKAGELSIGSIMILLKHFQIDNKSSIRLKCLEVLSTQIIAEEDLNHDLLMEIICVARNVNSSGDVRVQAAALIFYRASLFPHCSRQVFEKRIDLLWPAIPSNDPWPEQYKQNHLDYSVQLSMTPAFQEGVVVHANLSERTMKAWLFDFDFHLVDGSKFLTLVLNVFTCKNQSFQTCLESKLKPLLFGNLLALPMAMVVSETIFGIEITQSKFNFSAHAKNLMDMVEEGMDLPEMVRGYRLVHPIISLLRLVKSYPLEYLSSFRAIFLNKNVLAKVLRKSLDSDLLLFKVAIELAFRLGVKTIDREGIFVSLKTEGVVSILTEKRDLLGEDLERVAEILKWAPKDSSKDVRALQRSSRASLALCERLLKVPEVDLARAIFLFNDEQDKYEDLEPDAILTLILHSLE